MKHYQPILKSLQTLAGEKCVSIIFENRAAFATDISHSCTKEGEERPSVLFDERHPHITIYIYKDDTLDTLAYKAIKAEEYMDKAEEIIDYKRNTPILFDYLSENLTL